jgi:hypothetical protein
MNVMLVVDGGYNKSVDAVQPTAAQHQLMRETMGSL